MLYLSKIIISKNRLNYLQPAKKQHIRNSSNEGWAQRMPGATSHQFRTSSRFTTGHRSPPHELPTMTTRTVASVQTSTMLSTLHISVLVWSKNDHSPHTG